MLNNDIRRQIAERLISDLRLSPAAAAGIVGNLDHETGGFKHMQELKPVVPGSRGGYGWAQWTGPRRRAFEAWSKENKLDPASFDANYGFLKHELTATPEGKVLRSLEGASDPGNAAKVFSAQFLRPGIPHMGSRVSRAEQVYAQLSGGAPQPSPSPTTWHQMAEANSAPQGLFASIAPGMGVGPSPPAMAAAGDGVSPSPSPSPATRMGGVFGAMQPQEDEQTTQQLAQANEEAARRRLEWARMNGWSA